MMPVHATKRLVIGLGTLALASLAIGGSMASDEAGPAADHPLPTVHCLDQLAGLPWPDLERLYRQSEVGTIPNGYARGRTIYCPDEPLAGPRAKVSRLLWHGKHFCAADATLVNQWCGFKAIRARSYYGPSWLDGKNSIILDYCGESRLWADVRDEMRQVAPGLYLGAMYLRRSPEPRLKLFFALETHP